MKTLQRSFTFALILVGFALNAQSNTYPWPLNGSIGIGIDNPSAKLHVNSDNLFSNIKISINHGSSSPNRWVDLGVAKFNSNFSPLARANDVVLRAVPGTSDFLITNVGAGDTVFANGIFGNESETMVITNDGNVGIGKTNPTDKLEVNGRIHARWVRIDLNNWSDYVFLPTYELKPLQEVELYIKKHGHLENIPSEEEVLENGIDLGEMNRLLLEKVEELTLYTIELNKKITVLESKIK